MPVRLRDLEQILRNSTNEWRWHVATVINRIPTGRIATYGTIARVANEEFGLHIIARNVAWLRSYLYVETNRDTTLPLHRIAKVGDTEMLYDSERTRSDGMILRQREGSARNPMWWNP